MKSFKAYILNQDNRPQRHLSIISKQAKPLDDRQVRVAVKYASLNSRDLTVRKGQNPDARKNLVPLSDGAGQIIEVGNKVTDWQIGDRVIASFFQNWQKGAFHPSFYSASLGGSIDGVLAEQITVNANGLVRIPSHLNFEQAATLPCAAVVAWHALFARGRPLKNEHTLLLQGTGGVALFGLQLAKAIGAKTIILSSCDGKLKKAKALGADFGINYITKPEWPTQVRSLTDGNGADHIFELGGTETFERSIAAVAPHGVISQIGVLTGYSITPNIVNIAMNNASVEGIMVGSKQHFVNLNSYLEHHKIIPVIDRQFAFDEAELAYDYLSSAEHFGKITIKIAD